MNYLSLYRKYRPHSFEEVVGQQYIVQILKNSIKNNKVANAYVFAGTKGTGKTSIAKIYANAINCLSNKGGDICNECEICIDFKNNQVMDVIELDAASNNGVDDIRKISDAVYTLPVKLNKKVYIIDEAHMLTTQAWNALLKVVEEPPKHVVFIFATTEMHKIPSTILSRCQCFRFNKLLDSDITKLLVKVCDKENIKYDLDALKVIAQIADGSARDSLSILEEVATFSDNNIQLNDIYKIYGLLSKDEMIAFLNLLASDDHNSIFKQTNKYIQSGINFASFVSLIISIITDKLIYLKTNNAELLTKTNEKLMHDLRINDMSLLIKLLDIWQEAYFKVINPTDVNIIIEHAVIKSIDIFKDFVIAPEVKVETKPEIKVQPEPIVEEPKPKVATIKIEPTKVVEPEITSEPKVEIAQHIVEQPKIEPVAEVKPEPVEEKLVALSASDEELFVNEPIEEAKPEPKSEPIAEPTIEPIVEVKPVEQPHVEVQDIPSSAMPNEQDILFAAAANNKSSKKAEANQVLKDLKDGILTEQEFGPIALSKGAIFASENAIVYAFEDELDAKVLNQNCFKNEFILTTCKVFRNPKYIVGFSIRQINNKKLEIQKVMKEHTLKELDLTPLRKVLDSDMSIEQLAYNTIYSQLDEKDRK